MLVSLLKTLDRYWPVGKLASRHENFSLILMGVRKEKMEETVLVWHLTCAPQLVWENCGDMIEICSFLCFHTAPRIKISFRIFQWICSNLSKKFLQKNLILLANIRLFLILIELQKMVQVSQLLHQYHPLYVFWYF